MRLLATLGGWLAGTLISTGAMAGQTLNIYHVGNSVTDTLNYNGLAALAAGRGNQDNWGRTMIPGAPLSFLWNHEPNALSQSPYGTFSNALANHTWNAVTLQPFDRKKGTVNDPVATNAGAGNAGTDWQDIPVIRGYINKALQNPANKDTQFYVYSRWPRRTGNGSGGYQPFNFQTQWDRPYTGGFDGTEETRDYFQDLVVDLRSIDLGLNKPINMVPVGDVLYELDKRMKAGQIPGYTDVTQFYSDGIHFKNVGSYVVGLTFYATLFKDNPNGLGVPANWNPSNAGDVTITPQQAALFQDAVWDVVNGHAYSGVAVPEPASMGMLGASCGVLLMRRRAVRPATV